MSYCGRVVFVVRRVLSAFSLLSHSRLLAILNAFKCSQTVKPVNIKIKFESKSVLDKNQRHESKKHFNHLNIN